MSKYAGEFYVDNKGVCRWKSNDAVPPQECLEEIFKAGEITEVKYLLSQIIRQEETDAFLKEYRKNMENHVPTNEDLFEMRSAFGEGTTVVNIFTGKEIKL